MRLTEHAIKEIKKSEALSLRAYPDPATGGEPWTIGYGHTSLAGLPKVYPGMVITKVEAEKIFDRDVMRVTQSVRALLETFLSEEQFSALVSFTFNLGIGNFRNSTLLKVVNAGELELAPAEFARWIKANGKVMNGLIKRRAKEGKMFMPNKLAYNHWKYVPGIEWHWPSFSPAEMACKGTGRIMLDIDAMNALQSLRDDLGKPMLITSAYRSPEHNKAVGGAKKSYHMKGVAFDVQMTNHDPAEFEKKARKAGFKGFGYYPKSGFMHIDTGRARTWGTKFEPRATRFEEERAPVEKVEKKSEAKGAGKTAVIVGGGTAAVEAARQAKDIATSGKTVIDVIVSYGPWVVAIVAAGTAAYFGWRWYQSGKEEQ